MKPNIEFKKAVIIQFIEHFEREVAGLVQSAKAAHLAATHEESRAEDRHDTFAIEASYLAAGQAARVTELQNALNELRKFLENLRPHATVNLGSLIELECEGKNSLSLVTQHGGGTKIQVEGHSVGLLSWSSPIGEQLQGLNAGDEFNVDSKAGSRDFLVVAVI